MLNYATVPASEIRNGDAFLVNGVNWTANTDAEFVRMEGTFQVRATDNYGKVAFIALTDDDYDVAYYADYASA